MSFSRPDSGVRKLSFAKKLAIHSRQISDEIRRSELGDDGVGDDFGSTGASDNNAASTSHDTARLKKRVSMSELDDYADEVFTIENAPVKRRPSGLETMDDLGSTLDEVMNDGGFEINDDDLDAIISETRQSNVLQRKKSNYDITDEDIQYLLSNNTQAPRRKVTVEKKHADSMQIHNADTKKVDIFAKGTSRDYINNSNGVSSSLPTRLEGLNGDSFSLVLPPSKKSRKKSDSSRRNKDVGSDVVKYTPKVAKAHQYFSFRKGKWADVETEYFELLVRLFSDGLLDILFNYPLRMFLAHSMACDPMRISKKFVGNKQIGKQRYIPKSYADLDAFDKNTLKALTRKFNFVKDKFLALLHQDIKAGPINGVWISEDDISLRVLWPEVIQSQDRRRNEDDIQSFELAPGAQNTRGGDVTSDSIDESLFGVGFGIGGGGDNEFLDTNIMRGEQQQQKKVLSMNLPKHVKKKPVRLPKIIVETRDPTKYTVGGVFQNGKYVGKVLEIDYAKSELLVEVHKQRYSLTDLESGKVTSKRSR
eukprot:g9844.t1